jgi:hypothetical protein
MFNYKDRSALYLFRKGLIGLFILFLFSSPVAFGQLTKELTKEEAPPLKDRLFYGGSFSLSLGTLTNIEIAPVIGIWALPRIAVAVGPTYWFYKYREDQTNIYGGRTYVEWVFLRGMEKFIPLGANTSLFLHCEDEMLSLDSYYWRNVVYKPNRFIVNTVLAGGGLSQQLGRRSSLNIMVLWVLDDSGYSLYSNPVIRLGFVF